MKRARRLRLESLEDRLALSGVAMLPEPPIALTDLTIRDAVAADLDGDTDHDVLIGGPQGVQWFENQGGTFAARVLIDREEVGWRVAAADVDGDGDTDIATLSRNQIAFFLNDGAADFSPADVIQADDGGWFSTIATGDTNGDGRADVVLVQRGQTAEPRKLIVLQHTGAGFERKDVAAPNVSDPMILLDINGDGHVDALDSSGRAFLGIDGTGNLAEGRLLLEAGVRTLAAGDFDGDDDLDLAYVVQNPATQDNELFVRNNQGGTDFAPRTRIHHQAPTPFLALSVANPDGDDDLDLLWGNVWLDNAAATFVPQRTALRSDAANQQHLIADFDLDGDEDVLVAQTRFGFFGAQGLDYFENVGGEPRFAPERSLYENISGLHTLRALDFDGDGDRDVLAITTRGTALWYENEGATFGAPRSLDRHPERARHQFADINGDGREDVVAKNDQMVYWLSGAAPADGFRPLTTSHGWGFVIEDFDGDGDADLMEWNEDQFRLQTNTDGLGTFAAEPLDVEDLPDGIQGLAPADADGDGDQDFYFWYFHEGQHQLGWVENDQGSYRRHAIVPLGSSLRAHLVLDRDGDGDQELLVATTPSQAAPSITWYEVSGDALQRTSELRGIVSAALADRFTHSQANIDLLSHDLDGDADADIVASLTFCRYECLDAEIVWFERRNDTSFASGHKLSGGPQGIASLAAADLDQDGLADLLVGADTGIRSELAWLRGTPDFTIQLRAAQQQALAGSTAHYEVIVENPSHRPLDEARVAFTTNLEDTQLTWECVVEGEGTCTAQAQGQLADTVRLAPGARLTYQLQQVIPRDAEGEVISSATLTAGGRIYASPERALSIRPSGFPLRAGTGQFDLNQSLETRGYLIEDMQLGDIDGDGDLDLLAAGEWMGLQTFRNDGQGGYSAAAVEAQHVESYDWLVRLADMDADGDLDAFVGGEIGDDFVESIRVYANEGDGNFRLGGTINTSPDDMEFGDLDGDGAADLVAEEGIWKNDGAGNFTLTQPLDIRAAHLVDVDRDGDLDLGYRHAAGFSVVFNDGAGNFSAPRVISDRDRGSLLAGDLNGNGHVDWILDGRLYWNDGDQTWTVGRALESPAFRSTLVDYDRDGDLDWFVFRQQASRVWFNDGAGSFARGDFLRLGNALAIADIDGDGDQDVLGADGATVEVRRQVDELGDTAVQLDVRQAVAGAPLTVQWEVSSAGRNHTAEAPIEIDLAGLEDASIACVSTAGSSCLVQADLSAAAISLAPNGRASFTLNARVANVPEVAVAVSLTNGQPWLYADADVSNNRARATAPVSPLALDPAPNANDANPEGLTLTRLYNDLDPDQLDHGNVRFQRSMSAGTGVHQLQGTQEQIHVSLDGDLQPGELVTATVTQLPGLQPWTWQYRAGVAASPGVFYESHTLPATVQAVGDLDADGDVDVIAGTVWLNDGSGQFSDTRHGVGQDVNRLLLGDFNGDGHLDVFVDSKGPNQVLLNDGGGRFRQVRTFFEDLNTRDSIVTDLDDDGDLDIVAQSRGLRFSRRDFRAWRNDGSGQFSQAAETNVNDARGNFAAIDLDSDGTLELLYSGSTPGNARVGEFQPQGVHGRWTFEATDRDYYGRILDWGDADQDGDVDLLSIWRNSVVVWVNRQGHYLHNQRLDRATDAAFADIDGDGDLDVLLNPRSDDTSAVWNNDGRGQFSATDHTITPGVDGEVHAADLDGDGDLDAIIGNTIYENLDPQQAGDLNRDGEVGFADFLRLAVNFGKTGVTLHEGDLTGDGEVAFDDFLLLAINFGKRRMGVG